MTTRLLAACAALLLVPPAAAIAQSAGDDQYGDPFAGKPQTSHPSPSSPSTPSSPSSPSPSSSPSQSSGSSAGGAQGGLASNTTQQGAPVSSASAQSGSLPRTGLRVWVLAAMGGLMLLGGILLRVGLRLSSGRSVRGSPRTLGGDLLLRRRTRG